jgi:hypothetical protein
MRSSSIVGLAISLAVVIGCGKSSSGNRQPTRSTFNTDMEATAEQVAAMPDTIRCDNAVVVRARDAAQRIEAQRRWLDRFYPGHGSYRQELAAGARQKYEVLVFTRSGARITSVCFDISSTWSR